MLKPNKTKIEEPASLLIYNVYLPFLFNTLIDKDIPRI